MKVNSSKLDFSLVEWPAMDDIQTQASSKDDINTSILFNQEGLSEEDPHLAMKLLLADLQKRKRTSSDSVSHPPLCP